MDPQWQSRGDQPIPGNHRAHRGLAGWIPSYTQVSAGPRWSTLTRGWYGSAVAESWRPTDLWESLCTRWTHRMDLFAYTGECRASVICSGRVVETNRSLGIIVHTVDSQDGSLRIHRWVPGLGDLQWQSRGDQPIPGNHCAHCGLSGWISSYTQVSVGPLCSTVAESWRPTGPWESLCTQWTHRMDLFVYTGLSLTIFSLSNEKDFNFWGKTFIRHFYAPCMKGAPGASSNWIVCLFSVRNSILLTNKVQYLKFWWWYSYQTWNVCIYGFLILHWHPMPIGIGVGRGQNVGLRKCLPYFDISCPLGLGGVKMFDLQNVCLILT